MTDKIKRDAFLYIENPGTPQFAQCDTCWLFAREQKRCAILGYDLEVLAGDTCGYYFEGTKPPELAIRKIATPEEVGFLKGTKVRCENCRFSDGECTLYKRLNQMFPEIFDLDPIINARGCCDAFKKR
jgi:hypothetical protein